MNRFDALQGRLFRLRSTLGAHYLAPAAILALLIRRAAALPLNRRSFRSTLKYRASLTEPSEVELKTLV